MSNPYTPSQERALKLFEILGPADPSTSSLHPVAVGRRLLLEGHTVNGCCHAMKIEGQAHYIDALDIDSKLVCSDGVFESWDEMAKFKSGSVHGVNGKPLNGGQKTFWPNDKGWIGLKFLPELSSALLALDNEIRRLRLDDIKESQPQSRAEERGAELFKITQSIGSDLRLGEHSSIVVARQLLDEGFSVKLMCNMLRVDAGKLVCVWLEYPECGSLMLEGRVYDDLQVMVNDFKKRHSHFMVVSDTKFAREPNVEIDVFSSSSVGEKLFPYIKNEQARLISTLEMMKLEGDTPKAVDTGNKIKPPRL